MKNAQGTRPAIVLVVLLLISPMIQAVEPGVKSDPGPDHHLLGLPTDTYPINGWGHHPNYETHNQQNDDLLRLVPSQGDPENAWIARADLLSPREISNIACIQNSSIPDELGLSDMNWLWGQFISHDIDFTLTQNGRVDGIPERLDIVIPEGDPWMDPSGTGSNLIMLFRSLYNTSNENDTESREHPNSVTGWLDGSAVYGSTPSVASWLRTGEGGRLKVTENTNGPLLPLADPDDDTAPGMSFVGFSASERYIAGDSRANEHAALTAIHILMIREHNRIADLLQTQHPDWTDEDIYQAARKYVTALIQKVTYDEYLPSMGVYLPEYQGFDPTVDPRITNAFATLSFRMGHSQIGVLTERLHENRSSISSGPIAMHDGFWNPNSLVTDGGIEPIFRGLAYTTQEANDVGYIDALRNRMFGVPGKGGMDMCAIDIQRGRDHGIPNYGTYRQALGLSPVNNWSDITGDPDTIQKMEQAYPDINIADPLMAMYAEEHPSDGILGESMNALLLDQFLRLRDGDPLFYLNDPDLQSSLEEIESTTLTDIILRNTRIEALQCDSMFAETDIAAMDCINENLGEEVIPDPVVIIGENDKEFVLNARFTEQTKRSGLDQINLGQPLEFSSYGPGIAAEDCDGDGRIDLAIGAMFDQEGWETDGPPTEGRMYMYRNIGDNRFVDITEASGLPMANSTSVGLTWADYDSDGDMDLHVANFGNVNLTRDDTGAPNALYKNNGDCTFVNVAQEVGIDNSGHSSKGIFADYDHDGDLDLYSMNFGQVSEAQMAIKEDTNILYRNLLRESGIANFEPITIAAGNVVGGSLYPSEEGEIYTGVPTSVAVTAPENPSAQMAVHSDYDPEGNGSGMSWAGLFHDMDSDGWEDIFIASDFGFSPMYRGSESGIFQKTTFEDGFIYPGTGMGVHAGDIEGDGDLDMCVSNYGPNFLWIQEEPRKWDEVAHQRGFSENVLVNWDCRFIDVDLDGDLDLWFGVGRINPFTALNNNSLYINDGDGYFVDGIEQANLLDQGRTMGSTWADFDGDGDLDLVTGDTNLGVRFFENDAAQREGVSCVIIDPYSDGEGSIHIDGIGANVDFHLSNGKVVRQAILTGAGFSGSTVSEARLGVPSGGAIEKVVIHWNNGETTTVERLSNDRTMQIAYNPDMNDEQETFTVEAVLILSMLIVIGLLVIRTRLYKEEDDHLSSDRK